MVTVKSLDGSRKSKIPVELDSHTDTSVIGSNVLVLHDHKCYVDVFVYDSKSRHKNNTTVDTAVVYDDPQTGDTSVLLINQVLLIPALRIYYCALCHVILTVSLLMTCQNSC